jgi:hypothetical protein
LAASEFAVSKICCFKDSPFQRFAASKLAAIKEGKMKSSANGSNLSGPRTMATLRFGKLRSLLPAGYLLPVR